MFRQKWYIKHYFNYSDVLADSITVRVQHLASWATISKTSILQYFVQVMNIQRDQPLIRTPGKYI